MTLPFQRQSVAGLSETAASDEQQVKIAVDFIFLLNTTINNIRLYPSGSDLIIKNVERIGLFFKNAFKQADGLEFGEFERTLVFKGAPLPEKEQAKPQAKAFLKLLLDWKIRNIRFTREISNREMAAFTRIMAVAPEADVSEDFLARRFEAENIRHVQVNKKIYTVRDEDESISAGFKLKDEDIAKHILEGRPLSDELLASLREMARDPEWLAKVFQSGVTQLMASAKGHSGDLSETFARMMSVFADISEYEKNELAEYILKSSLDMDDDAFFTTLTQDLATVFGDNFLNMLVSKADDGLFSQFVSRVRRLSETVASQEGKAGRARIVTNRQLAALVKSVKSAQKLAAAGEGPGKESLSRAEKERAGTLADLFNGIVRSPSLVSHERVMLDRTEETVKNLLENRKYSTIVSLFGQMANLLQNRDLEVRQATVALLLTIDEQFEAEGCFQERIALSRKLLDWLQWETILTPLYETILDRLRVFVSVLVKQEAFREAEPVLQALAAVAKGRSPKPDDMRRLALQCLKQLAAGELMGRYLRAMQPGASLAQDEDIAGFAVLGEVNLDRLLDLLHDSRGRSERYALVRVISRVGDAAAGPVAERIALGGPWFYLRNLALVLGRVGSEPHLKALETLLRDKHPRVQREAVLAIQNIGGRDAARLLYQYLPDLGEELKVMAVAAVAQLRYDQAASDLLALLESGPPAKSKKVKNDMMVKLCEGLGRMGTASAIPALERVARPRGLLAKAQDPLVRAAAEEACQRILHQQSAGSTPVSKAFRSSPSALNKGGG